jgi:hypothetical protein
MRGAVKSLLVLVVLVFSAGSVVGPAPVLAKPKPVKYVLVSETKGCIVTLNLNTGRLTFKAEKGHYGKFTVVVRHGKTKRTYHFTVKQPKPGRPGRTGGPRDRDGDDHNWRPGRCAHGHHDGGGGKLLVAAEMCLDLQSGGLTYVVTDADVGLFIQVVETAHGNGTATFTTVPTVSIVG